MYERYRAGFSLIELSIVLMIMGFLAGIVAMGKNLMHEASIQQAITELSAYKGFALQFKGRYGGWPGDMFDASRLWGTGGASTACPGVINMIPSLGSGGCNGDGDDVIELDTVSDGGNNSEPLRAWQHLVLSGLIVGAYPGIGTPQVDRAVIGATVPFSELGKDIGFFYYNYTGQPQDNVVGMGGFFSAATVNDGPILTPYEAQAIDYKLDDGYPLPGRGEIVVPASQGTATNTSGCFNNTQSGGRYNLTVDEKLCSISYKLTWRPKDAY